MGKERSFVTNHRNYTGGGGGGGLKTFSTVMIRKLTFSCLSVVWKFSQKKEHINIKNK